MTDQIPDSDSDHEAITITPAKAGATTCALAGMYTIMTGEEPPEEMGYHLAATSRYLGTKIDGEAFGELREKYGPTHPPESKSASTQTLPQPAPPTRRYAGTNAPEKDIRNGCHSGGTTGTNICNGSDTGVSTTDTSETQDEQCLPQHRPPRIPVTSHV